jgi:hypothetical protein
MNLEKVLNLLDAQKKYWDEKSWLVNVEALEIAIKIIAKEYLKELDCKPESGQDGNLKIVDEHFFE